jgi:uncharacterized protein YbbC (DUF1343 family)/CubicO group peptidase (beta-lactamase class C family)
MVIAVTTLSALLPIWAQGVSTVQHTSMTHVGSHSAVHSDGQVDTEAIDSALQRAIQEHRLPGAVVLIGHHGHVVFRKAYGMRSLEPQRETMTLQTVFDMASLTKPLMTATAVMQLFEQGKLRLDDPVAEYLPDFANHGKSNITIRNLLTHYSGLPADLDLKDVWSGKDEGYRRAMDSTPVTAPGVQFRYSDINFIVLGALVEKVSGNSLQVYADKHIIKPLGLQHTGFLPAAEERSSIAPTQYDEQHQMLRGVVHDPTSRRMGGVAGHAGLFSTADDVSVYAQNLMDKLAGRPSKFPLKRLTLLKMTTPGTPATGTALRGLGWDIESPFSSNRGELFPVGSFGHTGFTGTSLWIDPSSDSYVIVLANAVHPDGPKGVTSVRATIANIAASSFGIPSDGGALAAKLTGYNESLTGMRRWSDRNTTVLNGIDVLEADHFDELAKLAQSHHGQLRLGLVTNQTGVDLNGNRTIDVLAKDAEKAIPGIKLSLLFSPEHGLAGTLDVSGIANSRDTATGLPVISLYGATDAERRPSPEDLRQLDAIVIDVQDAGVRFYTYETVVRYFLEACAKSHTAVIVLDRPDPLGGSFVQGPLSDPGTESYVNVANIPVRHGMTLGELARWMNAKLDLHAPLSVVAMKNWQRGDWFDSTAQAWISPSPNLRSLNEATLYPGIGLIETTNISVGRGTDTPFELVGAPWIDARQLAQTLNGRDLPGVRFIPVTFTPGKPYPYAGQVCHGVNLMVTARNDIDAPELGLEIVSALQKLYPADFKLAGISRLLANKNVLDALLTGTDPLRLQEEWRAPLDKFEDDRKPYLLYGTSP